MAGQDVADGTPFGRYRLVELLGRGGMGEVWRAYDTTVDRTVAIKMLLPQFAQDKKFEQRFRREARAAARLDNPHVLPIHDVGEVDGRLYVTMRLINGQDLQTLLDEAGPLEPQRAVAIIEQVAKALSAAHKIGLIHRDIKPSNVLLDDDFAYLIDFGIARAAGETGLTSTGATVGTWSYMAPERFNTGYAEASSDIYALACVLYQCLTGQLPFPAVALEQIAVAHMTTPPPQPSTHRPGIPAAMDEVIATGLAKDPAQRYATTIDLAHAARAAITKPIQRPAAKPTPIRKTPARKVLTDQAATLKAKSPPHAKPAPPRAAPRIPARAGGTSRRTIAFIAGAIALVAVIAGAVGISALGKHGPTESSPTSSSPPTLSAQPYGAQIELPFTGLTYPDGVAVDGSGSVYVADYGNNRVLKLAGGSGLQTELPFTGLNDPEGVAVDGSGNVYVTDHGNHRVLKLAGGSGPQTELLLTGLSYPSPSGVAVDVSGSVYVADFRHGVVKLVGGSGPPTTLPFTGLSPYGICVAVDGSGSVYVADYGSDYFKSQVLKLAGGSGPQNELPFTGLNHPKGVVVDGSGNVYVADFGNKRVVKLAGGSGPQTELPFTGLGHPEGVAVDVSGSVYVTDYDNHRVLKLPMQ